MTVEHKLHLREVFAAYSKGYDFDRQCAHFYSILCLFEIADPAVAQKMVGQVLLTSVDSFQNCVAIEEMPEETKAKLEQAGANSEDFDHERLLKLQLVDVEGCRTAERAVLSPRPTTLDLECSVEFPGSFLEGDFLKEGVVKHAEIQLVTTF